MNQVYVKIEKYNEVTELLASIRGKLEEAKESLRKIAELKAREDAELTNWQNELGTFEEKFSFVTSALERTEEP